MQSAHKVFDALYTGYPVASLTSLLFGWLNAWGHAQHARRAVNRGERNVLGVTPRSDADKPLDRGHFGGVEDHPLIAEPRFEYGMKVRRTLWKFNVTDDKACGNVERGTKRDAQVREVAAHAFTLQENITRRRRRVR